jgi:hypothetical protein
VFGGPDSPLDPFAWLLADEGLPALDRAQIRTGEVCFVGAAGTGKTRGILEWLHRRCLRRPGVRVLLLREYREDHTQSTMKTLQLSVFPEDTWGRVNDHLPITWVSEEQAYVYPNGSAIIVKGLRDSRGIYSQEYDHIFVNEAGSLLEEEYDQLLRAKRWGHDDLSLLITDLNPEFEMHWLHQRCDDGVTTEVLTQHSDNPALPPAALADLARMRDPVQRQRLYLGQRVSAMPNAYYQEQLAEIRHRGHIRPLEPQKGLPVHTCWDIGYSDYTAIWLFQRVLNEWHFFDYYESHLEELDHYWIVLQQMQAEYKLVWGTHCLPHDAAYRTLASGGKSIQEMLWKLGIRSEIIVPRTSLSVQHSTVRANLSTSYFDTSRWEKAEPFQRHRRGCKWGVQRLAMYRAGKDERLGVMKDRPEHDQASHGASAIATGFLADPRVGSGGGEQERRNVDWLPSGNVDEGQSGYRRVTR